MAIKKKENNSWPHWPKESKTVETEKLARRKEVKIDNEK